MPSHIIAVVVQRLFCLSVSPQALWEILCLFTPHNIKLHRDARAGRRIISSSPMENLHTTVTNSDDKFNVIFMQTSFSGGGGENESQVSSCSIALEFFFWCLCGIWNWPSSSPLSNAAWTHCLFIYYFAQTSLKVTLVPQMWPLASIPSLNYSIGDRECEGQNDGGFTP